MFEKLVSYVTCLKHLKTSVMTSDVNTFLSCDNAYEIVEANHINEQGIISGSALVSRPKKDLGGQIVKDDDGETVYEDVLVPVRLHPTGGELDVCSEAEEDKNERQCGGLGFYLLALVSAAGLRLRKTKTKL